MNAIPKLQPIESRALARPSFRRWDLVRANTRNAWIIANDDLLRSYYRATGERLRAAEDWTPPSDPQVDFTIFCDIQFEREFALYEELKFERDYEYEGATNGSVNWEES